MDKAQLIDYALVALGTGLVALLGAGLKYAATWIAAHTQTKVDDAILPKLAGFADLAIKSTFQAYVKPLKTSGQWTQEAHAAARQMAYQELVSYLGPKGLRAAAQAAGGDVEKLLLAMIDSAVHDNKRSGDVVSSLAAAALERVPLPPALSSTSGDRVAPPATAPTP